MSHERVSHHHYDIRIHTVNKPNAVFDVNFIEDGTTDVRTIDVRDTATFSFRVLSMGKQLPDRKTSEANVIMSDFAPTGN